MIFKLLFYFLFFSVYAKNTLDRENIKIKENFNFQFQVQAKYTKSIFNFITHSL